MKKPILWALAAVAVFLLIYFIVTKTLVLPWLGDKVAAVLVGAIGLIGGLFLRRKRNA